MRKLKLFSLIVCALFATQMWADTEVWSADLQETIDGVTQTKGRNSDTWSANTSLSWAPEATYPYRFNAGGSSSKLTLTFDEALQLQKEDIITIYWGATNSRTMTFSINGTDKGSQATTATSTLMVYEYELTEAVSLSSLAMATTGSGTYFFKVTIIRPTPKTPTGTGTITYTMIANDNAVKGKVANVNTITGLATAFTTSTLTVSSGNSKAGYSGKIEAQEQNFNANVFISLPFTIAENYTFTISSVDVTVFANGTSDMKAKVVLTDGTISVESEEISCANSDDSEISFAADAFVGKKFKGTITMKFYFWNKTGKRAYIKSPVTITGNVSEECAPIGVAATGTATDVTYNSASLPFTMDNTTGVSSLTIDVFKNSDDSKVATYSNITPATSGSQAATGLSESTTYYYTITTVSAGGDYCEGETTAKSATFTTTAAPVAKPEITGAVNEEGWGTVAPSSIIVTSGDELSIAGNVITCGGKTLTATAADATAEYTYAFDSWSGVTNGQSVTTNLTATANFSRTPNTYNITYTAPTNGNYTIKVGEESAVSENTTADYGQTVTLAASPSSGYKFSGWTVMNGETPVEVSNNQFTMPAANVTVSATFVQATVLYDCSVMTADNKWLSFTGEEVTGNDEGTKDKTFGTEGNPQLVIKKAGWDKKDNIINSFIKFFGGKTSMSIVIPANKLATITIKYGSYKNTEKYLMVNDVAQNKPQESMVDGITAETYENYMGVVELTDQSGTLVLNSNTGNIYIAYVDVAITGTITPTALDNTDVNAKAVKRLENGMLVIEKNGHVYNVLGGCVK